MTPRCSLRAASIGVVCLSATGLLGMYAVAGEQPEPSAVAEQITYVPPDPAALATRTPTRSPAEGEQPAVQVVAPEATGLTLEAQPTLYWFVTAPTDTPMELRLSEEKGAEPLLDVALGPASVGGFHRLQLAEHGVELEPGVEYRWSVAQDVAAQRSPDAVSSATIRRILPDPDLAHGMEQADPMQKLGVLARHGYWYDLITLLSAGIESHAENLELIRLRADLLEQVGLEAAAAADRKAIGAQ